MKTPRLLQLPRNALFKQFISAVLLFHAVALGFSAQLSVAEKQITPTQNPATIELEKDYANFLQTFLTSNKQSGDTPKLSGIKVFDHVKTALDRDNIPQALNLVQVHRGTITKEIDSKASQALIGLAIRYDVKHLTDYFVQYAKANSNSYTNSGIYYQLALDSFDRGNFEETLDYLTKLESSALSTPRRNYATLMFGISLQKTRKHREAIDIYEKFNSKSSYYHHSLLNLAVAYIKQGWWTDAQLTIEKAMKVNSKEDPEFINRLYVVLGYSQLKNEFYRNARTTFRNVSLDSQYMSRALLGIGLSAIHQRDYTGALNAFDRLKNNPHYDITVAESNLLVPFTFERMKELDTASAGYTEAIAYFGSKLLEFENYSPSGEADISSSDPAYYLLEKTPDHWRNKEIVVRQLVAATRGSSSEANAKTLHARIQNQIKQSRMVQVKKHLTELKSYMSQAQYGFAKLYDENR